MSRFIVGQNINNKKIIKGSNLIIKLIFLKIKA